MPSRHIDHRDDNFVLSARLERDKFSQVPVSYQEEMSGKMRTTTFILSGFQDID